MELRYFVMRKKEGNKRYSHTNEVFYNLEDAIDVAKTYNDSRVECVDYKGKTISIPYINKEK